MRPLAMVLAVTLGLVALAACSDDKASVEGAAKELVESLAARDTVKVAQIMDTSEDEAARTIAVSFAGRSQEIRDLIISPGEKGCEELSAEQLANGVTAVCHVLADLQFNDPQSGQWQDLRLAFVVELCGGRAIVSLDNASYVPRC
ncbi:MAG: hypothetical protein A2V88_10175 [Elusimicrobia bacterium RBG_16_66_12]|nr:MAG: hypothetical protein A2V88_10175 [Elusimicrobia bacterium RBG_16_66_12]